MSSRQTPSPLTLRDLLGAIERAELSAGRSRDLRSAVVRVAKLLRDEPGRIPLVMPDIARQLAEVQPAAAGLSEKSLSNIRSGFLAAVRLSGLTTAAPATPELDQAWADLMSKLATKRHRIGLSRLAHYASAHDIEPQDLSDTVLEDFIKSVREGSLHKNPSLLKRKTTAIWNEVATVTPSENLQKLKPVAPRAPKRVPWEELTAEFRADVDAYLAWLRCDDKFAEDARDKPLAARTIKLRRHQIHAAVTALVGSGVDCKSVLGLRDLVTDQGYRRIFRRREDLVGKDPNGFNRDLAEMLVRMAKEWVRLDGEPLQRLRRVQKQIKAPASGLTRKNKQLLRQFDDPEVWQRLLSLPDALWCEAKREKSPTFHTLAKAQAAIAIRFLTYLPIRIQNLSDLQFDQHLFLSAGKGGISSLEIPGHEVKNGDPIAFDVPKPLAEMIREYRDHFAPRIVGCRPDRLFVNANGSPKTAAAVADLIKRSLAKCTGVKMTPHQFRHLAAKTLLDQSPGAYETVRQLLGHKNLKTTVSFYAGIDTRRAGNHHFKLIEEAARAQTTRWGKTR